MKFKLIIIAAVSSDGIIGIDNEIPWNLREDLLFYRRHTINNFVVVGRKTYELLPDKAKFGRNYLVIGKTKIINGVLPYMQFDDIMSLNEYIKYLDDNNITDKVFIAGGGTIYNYFIDKCDEILLTKVEMSFENAENNKKISFPVSKLLTLYSRYESELRKSKEGIYYSFEKYKWNER